ncbi:hypothetical protein ACFE04_022146 [Oxalis oulophora]
MEISSSLTCSLSRPPPPPPPSFLHSTFLSCQLKTPQQSSLVLRTRRTEQIRKKPFSCNALFGLGVPELVVIAGVTAFLFGPRALPQVGKSIGKTVKSFQQGVKEFESELKKESDSSADPQGELPKAASDEEKQDAKVSSFNENV